MAQETSPLGAGTAPERTRRLTRDDWLVQGLAQLTSVGPEGVRLEAICDSLGKTRGSFYHHFDDHELFVDQMMALWRDMNTEDVIDLVDMTADFDAADLADLAEFSDDIDAELMADIAGQFGASSGRLSRIAALMDHRMEQAIRRFALGRPAAMAVVSEIDQRRIDLLTRIITRQFGIETAAANELAEVEYAAFVGCLHLFPDAPAERLDAIGSLVDRMVTLAATDQG